MRLTVFSLIVVLGAMTCAGAQDLQRGTKTVPAHLVAYVGGASALPEAQADVRTAFGALWGACMANGLHPLGLVTLCMDVTGIDTGTLQWEARLTLVDDLDPSKLPDKPQAHVKLVPEGQVVYTFVAGDPWKSMPAAFGELRQWATNQNLALTTKAHAIVYLSPLYSEPAQMLTECQFELREP